MKAHGLGLVLKALPFIESLSGSERMRVIWRNEALATEKDHEVRTNQVNQ